MLRNLDNCFYCQELKNYQPQKGGKWIIIDYSILKCSFCGVYNNPLYLINYQGKEKYFCCGCAWWQEPRSKQEKKEEEKWYKEWKNKTSPETKKTINAN